MACCHPKFLAKAKTHGSQFFTTGGRRSTCDDVFISAELPIIKAKLKKMEADKIEQQTLQCIHTKAMAIINSNIDVDKLNNPQLQTLLSWHQIPKKEMGRKSKKLTILKKNIEEGKSQPKIRAWKEEEKAELEAEKRKEISIPDTALGHLNKVHVRDLENKFALMDDNKQN